MRAGEVSELWEHLTPDERAEALSLLESDKAIWRPQPGPQADAFYSEADITGYGGSAGGGKTDLLCGSVLTAHRRSVIFRREKAQTERITQRLTEILGHTDGLNGQKGIWQLGGGRLLELGGLDNLGDERRWQGRDHDLKAYDEVTEMREDQVRYTMGWNRTADPKQRSRVIMTFNPPTTTDGQWVIRFFGPWLDNKHPNPAKPGELRWFTTLGGRDVEVPSGRPFVFVDGRATYEFDPKAFKPEDIIRPKSRTFIPSRVTDNPYYMASGYIQTLQSLPEPLRSQMLNGDFTAGIKDDVWQVIPTAWVDAAMARWAEKHEKGPMDSLGVDVARGGDDVTVIARRHGTWFDVPLRFPGQATPDGPTVAGLVVGVRRDRAPVHVDVVGWGASAYDHLIQSDVHALGINGANKTDETTADAAKMGFYNKRALLWWRMREALDPNNPHPIALPNDAKLKADLCAPKWKPTTRGILIESKEEIQARLHRSPDDGDAYVLALMATPKFEVTGATSVTVPNYGAF